jgi:hypothetical protein
MTDLVWLLVVLTLLPATLTLLLDAMMDLVWLLVVLTLLPATLTLLLDAMMDLVYSDLQTMYVQVQLHCQQTQLLLLITRIRV